MAPPTTPPHPQGKADSLSGGEEGRELCGFQDSGGEKAGDDAPMWTSLQMPKGSCDKELRRPIAGGRGRPAKKASRPLRGGWVGWKHSKGGADASNPAENSGREKKNLRPAPEGPDDITTSQSGGCQFHVSVSLVGFTGQFHFREGVKTRLPGAPTCRLRN